MHNEKTSTQKLAISRALGAAFLSHQVEQLEKSVQSDGYGNGSRGYKDQNANRRGRRGGGHYTSTPQSDRKRERNGKEDKIVDTKIRTEGFDVKKEADVVVLDASVLIHCLNRIKDWCRKGRQEILVVPLEALNTLDFLKKGSSSLAQKARAASRLLEAQVGSNPRIRVQRDDAFVPWDDINFQPVESSNGTEPAGGILSSPPEWLRRTICCAQWEIRNALSGGHLADTAPQSSDTLVSRPATPMSNKTYSTSSAKEPEKAAIEPQLPPLGNENTKVSLAVMNNGPSDPALASTGRYDRADGTLVRIWSQRAGIGLLLVEPMPVAPPPRSQGHDKREFRDGRRDKDRRPSLVEKPISIAIVNDQPVKNLRLLARGEKLDP